MTHRAGVVLGVCLIASTAAAQPREDLMAKGQDLAKRGEWSQAITVFKQADAQEPRAANACFIGLAYLRREMWAQAELFFAKCHARSTASDPLPAWVGEAEAQLAQKLRDQNVAEVTIDVTPAVADPAISITGFLPDELAGRGTVHLVPGRYTLSIRAPGYVDATREIDVKNREAQVVRVALEAPRGEPLPLPAPAPVVVRAVPTLPWIVLGSGVAIGAAGVIIDVTKVRALRADLSSSTQLYDRETHSFDSWREGVVGLWIGGAVVAGIGTYLALRSHPDVTLSARVDRGSGALLVGWHQ